MYGKRQKLKFCVGNDYPTIIELLEKILAQMKTRQHVINELGDDIGDTAYTLGMTPLLLVIDELAALTASLTDNKQK